MRLIVFTLRAPVSVVDKYIASATSQVGWLRTLEVRRTPAPTSYSCFSGLDFRATPSTEGKPKGCSQKKDRLAWELSSGQDE
ncbi:hypothetical protein ANO14919_042880 [Xylariales sp. No.14919]|nr:hypothetical protein ANO14919_042880 [Xylariales sp. No.14919]